MQNDIDIDIKNKILFEIEKQCITFNELINTLSNVLNLNFKESKLKFNKIKKQWNIKNPTNEPVAKEFLEKYLDNIYDIITNEIDKSIYNKILFNLSEYGN